MGKIISNYKVWNNKIMQTRWQFDAHVKKHYSVDSLLNSIKILDLNNFI